MASFGEGASGQLLIVDYAGTVLQLTQAIPEPTNWAMWLAGLAAIGWRMGSRGFTWLERWRQRSRIDANDEVATHTARHPSVHGAAPLWCTLAGSSGRCTLRRDA